jgi:hypothetical protein
MYDSNNQLESILKEIFPLHYNNNKKKKYLGINFFMKM